MDSIPETNVTKVRLGLALISVIVAVSVVMMLIADDAVSRGIFFAVAAVTVVRAALLVRWLRRRRTAALA